MTFVGFRVSLPPKPPYQGGLAWRWRPACWLGAVRAVSLRLSSGQTKRLTGRLGPYGKPLTERDGPYGKGRSLREGPLRGWLASQKRTTKRLAPYGKAPYGETSYGKAPSRRFLTGDTFHYRKAYEGKPLTRRDGPYRKAVPYGQTALREGPLRGGFLREGPLRITGRAGPFLDLLPFKGPFSLTGALTGPPYGTLRGGFLREGWALTGSPLRGGTVLTGRAGVPYGSFTEKDDEEAYGKAPYGEASHEKAPYELQESLREATGRDFTRIGREFPLVCRRPKKAVFS